MDFLLLRLFPLVLGLGGVLFLVHETRLSLHEPRKGRWLRRALGALLLVALAVMIYLGQIPDRASMTPDQMWRAFEHWLAVLAVALLLMGLAAWDALVGVRQLRGYFEGVEREELDKIQEHLKRHQ